MTPAQLPLPRLFEGREAALASLDGLARKLWLGAMVHSQGRLRPRLDALLACRAALVAGRLPEADALDWPDAPLGGSLRELLSTLGLPAFCLGNGDLADQVVSSLLWHLDRLVNFEDLGASQAQASAWVLEEFGAVWRERCGMIEEMNEIFGECEDLFKNANWDLLRGTMKTEAWQELVRAGAIATKIPCGPMPISSKRRTRRAH